MNTVLCGAENWTQREADQKCLESFEIYYWKRTEEISWTDRVRNEEALHGVKEQRNILHTVQIRNANWIGHILCRNCLLKQAVGGNITGWI